MLAPRVALRPDVRVTGADIQITPRLSKPGDTVTCDVTVRNVGPGPANGVKIVCTLLGNGPQRSQQFSADIRPEISLAVTAIAACDSDPSNNRAVVGLGTVQIRPMPIKRF